jgi:hypothetical protein
MKKELYPENELKEDLAYVAKKLDMSPEELQNLIKQPNKSYKDYPSNERLFRFGIKAREKLKL